MPWRRRRGRPTRWAPVAGWRRAKPSGGGARCRGSRTRRESPPSFAPARLEVWPPLRSGCARRTSECARRRTRAAGWAQRSRSRHASGAAAAWAASTRARR
eukprot:2495532-Prymnesium_polylepis.1